MYLVAPVSLCVLIFTSFANLFAIASSSLRESFHLPKHFITLHTTHLCCIRPVVAEQSHAKPSVDSGTFPCPWAPGPFGNDFICRVCVSVCVNKMQNSFNHIEPKIWTKEANGIRGPFYQDLNCHFRQPVQRALSEAQTWEMHYWGCGVHEVGSGFIISTPSLLHFWSSLVLSEVCALTTSRGN